MRKKVNISEIKPNDNNPRFITDAKFKKLVKSIKDFPEMLETRPLVIDEDFIVLGGNMRLKALKSAGVFEVPVYQVKGWTKQKKQEFIIKDNIGYGQWDWDSLSNGWDEKLLNDWALDIPEFTDVDDFGTDFELNSEEKSPFEQQTYTLSKEQSDLIKKSIKDVKNTESYKYVETFGNENSNGNALYLIFLEWISKNK